MNYTGFIARRLHFKGKAASVSIAVSFFVMILAVSISSGFRKEIRSSLASFCGDIQLVGIGDNYLTEDASISSQPSYISEICAVEGVESIAPAVYRAGILRNDGVIQGVVFKGVEKADSLKNMRVSLPRQVAEYLGVGVGDKLSSWFVGEKLKARRFTVASVYEGRVDVDNALPVLAYMGDLQRLNGWDSLHVSALELTLSGRFREGTALKEKTAEIGTICYSSAREDDDDLLARSIADMYPQLFGWLDLIDFNVLFILLIMTVVAGVNMISGLLILLFRNISTIGTLKSMGMTDRSIASVFLKTSSRLIFRGMLTGNLLALLFCAVQGLTHAVHLNPDNYFLSFVPVDVDLPLILAADVAAYVVIMLLLLIPCLFISSVDPARTVHTQ